MLYAPLMPDFTCRDCGSSFSLPQHILDRYPGWTPRQCRSCRDGGAAAARPGAGKPARSAPSRRSGGSKRSGSGVDALHTTEEVLAKYTAGPDSGVFTDGGAVGNPGPGGWGAVYVVKGEIVAEASGHDPDTTNNRMELTALLEAVQLVPEGTAAQVYADSKYAVQTITEWAAGWERRGWKRKGGPVKNLDLVRPVYYAFRNRPELDLQWIAAHQGYRWNEYADALANAWRLG